MSDGISHAVGVGQIGEIGDPGRIILLPQNKNVSLLPTMEPIVSLHIYRHSSLVKFGACLCHVCHSLPRLAI